MKRRRSFRSPLNLSGSGSCSDNLVALEDGVAANVGVLTGATTGFSAMESCTGAGTGVFTVGVAKRRAWSLSTAAFTYCCSFSCSYSFWYCRTALSLIVSCSCLCSKVVSSCWSSRSRALDYSACWFALLIVDLAFWMYLYVRRQYSYYSVLWLATCSENSSGSPGRNGGRGVGILTVSTPREVSRYWITGKQK